jgi:hypothetical protein
MNKTLLQHVICFEGQRNSAKHCELYSCCVECPLNWYLLVCSAAQACNSRGDACPAMVMHALQWMFYLLTTPSKALVNLSHRKGLS